MPAPGFQRSGDNPCCYHLSGAVEAILKTFPCDVTLAFPQRPRSSDEEQTAQSALGQTSLCRHLELQLNLSCKGGRCSSLRAPELGKALCRLSATGGNNGNFLSNGNSFSQSSTGAFYTLWKHSASEAPLSNQNTIQNNFYQMFRCELKMVERGANPWRCGEVKPPCVVPGGQRALPWDCRINTPWGCTLPLLWYRLCSTRDACNTEAQRGELQDGVAAFFLNAPAFTDINQPLYLHVNICN